MHATSQRVRFGFENSSAARVLKQWEHVWRWMLAFFFEWPGVEQRGFSKARFLVATVLRSMRFSIWFGFYTTPNGI
jgi:hypothetical protein